MFGLTMAEGAALLGEATVRSDGSWLADIPPYVPVHLQPIDEFDLSIRSQTTWIQGMPGEGRVCGGCHEDRTGKNVGSGQALTIAAGMGAEKFIVPVMQRTEYPWAYADDTANPNEIQKLLDSKCSSCHNETTNGNGAQEFYTVTYTNELTDEQTEYQIPRLDLSSRPITVTYDRETRTYPASYVSLFYPAAMEMEMEDAEITGTVPPKWALPSDARNSAMIEKLNVTSSLTPTKYAWPLGEAFSDANIAGGSRTDHAAAAGLTRDEIKMLIRAIDMGGQFYARQNTAFQPVYERPGRRERILMKSQESCPEQITIGTGGPTPARNPARPAGAGFSREGREMAQAPKHKTRKTHHHDDRSYPTSDGARRRALALRRSRRKRINKRPSACCRAARSSTITSSRTRSRTSRRGGPCSPRSRPRTSRRRRSGRSSSTARRSSAWPASRT